MSPQFVALWGLAMAWTCPPILGGMLLCDHSAARWLSRGVAVLMLGLWVPLVIAAPSILRHLLG